MVSYYFCIEKCAYELSQKAEVYDVYIFNLHQE